MTDDFQLFPDTSGGEAIDADISLITAYLARELSLVQVAAVEDRLATDAAFRDKVAPIIEAWMVPGAYGPARKESLARKWEKESLASEEVEAGWQRYLAEAGGERVHARPRILAGHRVEHTTQRRKSMTRIAAVITAIVLPVVTVAQVVAYVAKHPDAPGHTVAQTIAAPFIDVQAPAPPPQNTKALPNPDDTPLSKQLRKAPLVEATAPVTAPAPVVTVTPPTQSVGETPALAAQAQPEKPDRARIAALVKENQPALARGDTTASYVVLLLDASGKYNWSTYGTGSVSLEVSGDKRTPAERSQFTRDNRPEYTGRAADGGGRGAFAFTGGDTARLKLMIDSMRAVTGRVRYDTALVQGLGRGGGGGGVGRGGGGGGGARGAGGIMVITPDSALRNRLRDTVSAAWRARGGGGGGAGAGGADSGFVGAGRGARGGGGGFGFGSNPPSPAGFTDSTGTYYVGISMGPGGTNEAYGLQEPGRGQSGIQGIPSKSIGMSEVYIYQAGEVIAAPLRVLVVHLVPGVTWKRF